MENNFRKKKKLLRNSKNIFWKIFSVREYMYYWKRFSKIFKKIEKIITYQNHFQSSWKTIFENQSPTRKIPLLCAFTLHNPSLSIIYTTNIANNPSYLQQKHLFILNIFEIKTQSLVSTLQISNFQAHLQHPATHNLHGGSTNTLPLLLH